MPKFWQQIVFCYDASWYNHDLPLLGRGGSPLITFTEDPVLHVEMVESFKCGGTENLHLDFGRAFGKLRAFIVTPLPEDSEELRKEVNLASFADVLQTLGVVVGTDPGLLCDKFLAKQEALKMKAKAGKKK